MDPINYLASVPQEDFVRDIAGGLQLGAGMRQVHEQQQAQQLARQRAAQYQADAAAFYQQPSAQAAMALSLKYPEQAKPIGEAYGAYTADQQRVALQDTAQLANLLHAGRADLATKEIDQRIEAAKNTGLPTSELEALRGVVQVDPKAAYAHALHTLSAIPGGDKVLTSLEGINKDAREGAESESKLKGEAIDQAVKNYSVVAQKAGALAKPGVKPAQAITMFKTMEARGFIPKGSAQEYIDGMPADAKELPTYLGQLRDAGMTPKDQKAFTTPSADATLSASTQRRGQDLRHSEWIEEQKGANEPGKPNETMAKQIAFYKAAPLGQFSLNKPWGQATMDRVMELNPDYDAAQYAPRAAALRSFAAGGKDGAAIESANTAMNHLATLKELALAQKNGDVRAWSKIANKISEATGGAAPSNLKVAVQMVAPEVVKAVSGVGGTGEDRTHTAKALAGDGTYSADQVLGAVDTAQELFAGRLKEKKRSYERSTKLMNFDDEFLSPAARSLLTGKGNSEDKGQPSTKPGKSPSAHPDDIDYLLNKYGSR